MSRKAFTVPDEFQDTYKKAKFKVLVDLKNLIDNCEYNLNDIAKDLHYDARKLKEIQELSIDVNFTLDYLVVLVIYLYQHQMKSKVIQMK